MVSLKNSPARRCNASTGLRLDAACDVERRDHVYNFKPRAVQLLDAIVTLSPQLQASIQTKLYREYGAQRSGGEHG